MINEKTKGQGETQLWSKQRVGRITASNFYKICHLREATNKDSTLNELLNYCPLPPERTPVQFKWGHDKEQAAIDLHIRKCEKKHQGLCVSKSGLVINTLWPHLHVGATMDDKSVETLGSKIRFLSVLVTFCPLPPKAMLIFLFLRLHRPQRQHNIELGGRGYQRINARCK